jgi:hypothetical protein
MSKREEVGVVSRITRYPLKSASGELVETARLGWHGLHGDRRFAFLQQGNATGFPWLTARELPELVTWKARHEDPDHPQRSGVLIQLPGQDPVSVRDENLIPQIKDKCGFDVRLVHLRSGIFDADDISIITTASIKAACETAGVAAEHDRFRANFEIEPIGEEAYPEDKWIGKRFVFGDRSDSARIRIYRRDPRCIVVDIDPEAGEVRSGLFQSIARSRKNQLGVYGRADGPGSVAVEDILYRLT